MLDIWSLARQQYLEESQKRTIRQQETTTPYTSFISTFFYLSESNNVLTINLSND